MASSNLGDRRVLTLVTGSLFLQSPKFLRKPRWKFQVKNYIYIFRRSQILRTAQPATKPAQPATYPTALCVIRPCIAGKAGKYLPRGVCLVGHQKNMYLLTCL